MKKIRYFLTFLLFVLLFTIFFPASIDIIPGSYKSDQYLNFLEKLIIPLGTFFSILIAFFSYLIQSEEREKNEKHRNYRELKIHTEIFETRKDDVWVYVLKIVFTNICFSNIYLSKLYLSYFLHSQPELGDLTFNGPLKIKLESGQQEEQIIYLSPLVNKEIENGYLLFKIIITDSFDQKYKCQEIRLNKFQKEDIIKIKLDES